MNLDISEHCIETIVCVVTGMSHAFIYVDPREGDVLIVACYSYHLLVHLL